MKIGERYYFDFNATAPLGRGVFSWLQEGDFPFANPSSLHASGKRSRREIDEVREELPRRFHLSEVEHRVLFHGGASEGITTLLWGLARHFENLGKTIHFFYFATDHACVVAAAKQIQACGHQVHCLPVDSAGGFGADEVITKLRRCSGPILLNWTWVNNETGILWPLARALHIKRQTGCFVHVDAVQSVGKIPDWQHLEAELDAYTFSAHKFGALKGVGFSFVGESFPFAPLIGGTQEVGRRGGTENLLGILSVGIALGQVEQEHHFESQQRAKQIIEDRLADLLGDNGEIVGRHCLRNGNTIFFLLKKASAQTVTLAFDLARIDVGSGSACASATITPSRVLRAMGYSEAAAKSGIRLSFSPCLGKAQVDEYWDNISAVLRRFV